MNSLHSESAILNSGSVYREVFLMITDWFSLGNTYISCRLKVNWLFVFCSISSHIRLRRPIAPQVDRALCPHLLPAMRKPLLVWSCLFHMHFILNNLIISGWYDHDNRWFYILQCSCSRWGLRSVSPTLTTLINMGLLMLAEARNHDYYNELFYQCFL